MSKQALVRGLLAAYPNATCALIHTSAYELLVATILSAQCTDARVNTVTPKFFENWPTVTDLARADTPAIEEVIHSTGFYRAKAKNLLGMALLVVDEYNGEIPNTMEDLITLPGVARKTANVILGTWYKKNEGVVVDTHVLRLSKRMGFTKEKNPVKVEQELMKLVAREEWTDFSHAMVLHGRAECNARKPRCDECPVMKECPKLL